MASDDLAIGRIDADEMSMADYIASWRDAYPAPEPKVYVSQAFYDRLLTLANERGATEEQLQAIVEVLPGPEVPPHPRRGGLERL